MVRLSWLLGALPAAAGFQISENALAHTVTGPLATVAGDFDSDGSVDFLVAGATTSSVSIFRYDAGEGEWEETLVAAGIPTAYGMATADVDGDGDLDVAIACAGTDPGLHLLLNTGTGFFIKYGDEGDSGKMMYGVGDGSYAVGVAMADLTGTGNQEIIFTLSSPSHMLAYRTRTSAYTATIVIDQSEDQLTSPNAFAVGDVDGDGDLDVVLPDNIGHVYVYSNDGSGAFSLAQSLLNEFSAPWQTYVLDYDLDGDLDVVVLESTQLSLLTNDGVGVLSTPVAITSEGRSFPSCAVFPDMDLDGVADVVVSYANDDSVTWLQGLGTSLGFGDEVELASGEDLFEYAFDMVAYDFDQDGDEDVMVSALSANSIVVLINSDVPTAPVNVTAATGDGSVTLSWGRPDDDGGVPVTGYEVASEALNQTFAAANATSYSVSGLENGLVGNWTVRAENEHGFGPWSGVVAAQPWVRVEAVATVVGLADGACTDPTGAATAPGDAALAVACSGDSTTSYWFAAESLVDSEVGAASPSDVAISDDGQLYWAVETDSGGAAVQQSSVLTEVSTDRAPGPMAVGDIDNDGGTDVIVGLVASTSSLALLMSGAGNYTTVDATCGMPLGLALADVDADDTLEVFAACRDSDLVLMLKWSDAAGALLLTDSVSVPGPIDVAVLSDTGAVVVATAETVVVVSELSVLIELTTSSAPVSLAVRDLDLDGDQDIIVGTTAGDVVEWFESLGNDEFNPAATLATGLVSTGGLETWDFDQDGDGDLVALDVLGSQVLALELQTVPFAPLAVLAAPLSAPGAVNVSWSPPSSDNGAEVTQFVVTDSFGTEWSTAGAERELVVDSVPGVSAAFSVQAVSYRGRGPASNASLAITTASTIVGVPTAVGAGELDAPADVIAADVDGDGLDDLVVCELHRGVSWFRNQHPTWDKVQQVYLNESSTTRAVAAADLDGDDDLDLVAIDTDGNRMLVFDNADGVGSFALQSATPLGGSPTALLIADRDGDGVLDVLVSLSEPTGLVWLAGPSWDTATTMSTAFAGIYALTAADLDNDGDLEVVVPCHDCERLLTFDAPSLALLQEFSGLGVPSAALVVPTTRDVVVTAAYAVHLFSNAAGDGVLLDPVDLVSTTQQHIEDAVLADFDLDGLLDIVVSSVTDGVVGFYSDMGPQQALLSDVDGAASIAGLDVDGDGDSDFAVAVFVGDDLVVVEVQTVPFAPIDVEALGTGYSGELAVSWGASDDNGAAVLGYSVYVDEELAGYTSGQSFFLEGLQDFRNYSIAVSADNDHGEGPVSSPAVEAQPAAVVDVTAWELSTSFNSPRAAVPLPNSDNGGVVVVTSNDNLVWSITEDVPGSFLSNGEVLFPHAVVACDLNGDGYDDFAVAGYLDYAVALFLYKPATLDFNLTQSVLVGGDIEGLVCGDVDGNGYNDLVVTDSGSDEVLRVDGPDFGLTSTFGDASCEGLEGLTLADVAQSGELDVLVACSGSDAFSWFGGGDGDFQQTFTGLGVAHEVVAGDVNGDGFPDAVVSSYGLSEVWLFENTGMFSFSPTGQLVTDTQYRPVHLALTDLDLDGDLDLLVAGYGDGTVAWYSNNGSSSFSHQRSLYDAGDAVDCGASFGLADMDADGDEDVVVMCASADSITVLYVDTVPFAPALVSAEATGVSGVVTVEWTESAGNGAPVSSYSVLVNGELYAETDSDTRSATLEGLTDGETYAITVSAETYRGLGPQSSPAVAVMPFTPVSVVLHPVPYSVGADEEITLAASDGFLAVAVTGGTTAYVLNATTGALLDSLESVYNVIHDLVLADLDNDGDSDVVLCTEEGAILIYIYNSDTGALQANMVPMFVTRGDCSVAVGDLNGDGDVDIAFAQAYAKTVGVYYADLGFFPLQSEVADDVSVAGDIEVAAAARTIVVPGDASVAVVDPTTITIAHLSVAAAETVLPYNDGADLVVLVGGELVAFPSFDDEQETLVATGVGGSGLALADLDRDGATDLVTSAVSWLPSCSPTATLYALGSDVNTIGVDARGDFDGDGDVDVFAFNATHLFWLEVQSAPFAPTNVAADAGNAQVVFTWDAADDNGSPVLYYQVFVDDRNFTVTTTELTVSGLVNGVTYSYYVSVANMHGTAVSDVGETTPTTPVELGDEEALAEADAEVVGMVGIDAGVLVVVTASTITRYVAPEYNMETLSTALDGAVEVVAADLNADGLQDIVIATVDGFSYMLSPLSSDASALVDVVLTDGSPAAGVRAVGGQIFVSFPDETSLYVVDFNSSSSASTVAIDDSGIGRFAVTDSGDVWAGMTDGRGVCLFSSGTYALQYCKSAYESGGQCPLVSGDTDNDGHTDVFVSNCDDAMADFPSAVPIPFAEFTAGAVTDLDLNGWLDAVFVSSTGSLAWYSSALGLVELAAHVEASSVALFDYDGDGDDDIAYCDFGTTSLRVLPVETVPLAPTDLAVALDEAHTSLTLSWTAPNDNGAALTAYSWWSNSAATTSTQVVTEASFSLASLDPGVTEFSVAAFNFRGMGAVSGPVEFDSCADGVADFDETDVDCGGPTCGACPGSGQCSADSDCESGDCEFGACASCLDGIQNQDETCVDGGGASCAPCIYCLAEDGGILAQWDAGPSGVYLFNGANTTATSGQMTGLTNYVSYAVVLEVDGKFSECTATPQPPRQLGAAVSLLPVVGVETDMSPAFSTAEGTVVGTADAGLLLFPLTVTGDDLKPSWSDLDADGDLDLLLGTRADGVRQFENLGNSSFVEVEYTPTGNITAQVFAQTNLAPAAGDFDADGLVDVVLGGSGTSVVIVFGDGDQTTFSGVASTGYASPTVCDFDSDGDLDIIYGSGNGSVGLVQNNGDPWSANWWITSGSYNPFDDIDVGFRAAPSCESGSGVLIGSRSEGADLFVPFVAHPEPPEVFSWEMVLPLEAALTWEVPYDGGADILTYAVTTNATSPSVITTSQTELAFTALLPGQTYQFTVSASNDAGQSSESEPFYATTPTLTVRAEQTLEAGELLVSWTVDADVLALANAVSVQVLGEDEVVLDVAGPANVTLSGLSCELHEVTVALIAGGVEVLEGSTTSAAPPLGVCPQLCPSASGFVDPSGTDPFAVECVSGNWTSLTGLSAEDLLLNDWSSHSLLTRNDSSAQLVLDVPYVSGADDECTVTDPDTGATMTAFSAAEAAGVHLGAWTPTTAFDVAVGLFAVNTTAELVPPALTNSPVDLLRDVNFSSNVAAASFELSVDGGEWAAWALASAYDADADGVHTVLARATVGDWFAPDATPASVQWEFDGTAPTLTFPERPDEYSSSLSAFFGLAASESNVLYEYCVDGSACGSYAESGTEDLEAPSTVLSSWDADEEVLELSSDFGTAVEVSFDSGEWVAAADPWAVDVSELLGDGGWHSVQARAVAAGAVDESPVALGLNGAVEDTTPPDTVLVTAPDSVVASGTAVEITATGTESGCSIEYSVNNGNFSSSWTIGTEDGFFLVAVRAVDAAGNADPTPALVAFQVRPAPVATLELSPATPTAPFSTSVFAVTVEGGSNCVLPWELYWADELIDSGEDFGADGTGTLVVGPLDFGTHYLLVSPVCELPAADNIFFSWEVTAESASADFTTTVEEGAHYAAAWGTDAAGNRGDVLFYNWTADVTAPDTVVAWPAAGDFVSASPELEVSCTDAAGCVFYYAVDGGNATTTTTTTTLGALSQGSHNVTVTAVDLAGNVDPTPAEAELQVDDEPPTLAVSSVGIGAAPTFAIACYDANGCASVTALLDGSLTVEVSSAGVVQFQAEDLADGAHTLAAFALDPAGNEASVSIDFEADSTPPETQIVDVPAVGFVSGDSDVVVVVSCSDASGCYVNFTINGEGYGGDWSDLPDGNISVHAFGVDATGNVDPVGVDFWFIVDTTAPLASFDAVTYFSWSLEAVVDVSCTDAETACSVGWSGDAGLNLTGLPVVVADDEGEFEVCITATDEAGNQGRGSCTILTFDVTAPDILFTEGLPDAVSDNTEAIIDFETEDWTAVACVPPEGEETVDTSVREGWYSYPITCTDERNQSSFVNVTWLTDRSAPMVTILDWTTGASTNDAAVSVSFSVDDLSPTETLCEALLDDVVVEELVGCASPWAPGLVLEGSYRLTVRAEDELGYQSTAQALEFAYDATVPTIDVQDAPSSLVSDANVFISFQCVVPAADACGGDDDVAAEVDTDCTLEYAVDSGERQAAGTGDVALTDLAEGSHVAWLYATDAAGNEATEAVSWTRSATAVSPTIVGFPPVTSGLGAAATFVWEVDAELDLSALVFVYRIDGGDWTDDGVQLNNVTVSDFALGPHTFSLAVVGSETDADTYSWTVAECQTEGELEFVLSTGELVCQACRQAEDTGCALNGVLQDGYWLPALETDQVMAPYECHVPGACVGGSDYGSCAEGYEGVICAVCEPGYAATLEGRCTPCGATDDEWVTVLLSIAVALAVVGLSSFLVRRSLMAATREGGVRVMATLKIMANYFLMMGILKDMNLDWGSMLTELFSYLGVVSGSEVSDIKLFTCAFEVNVYQKFSFLFAVPAFLIVVPLVVVRGGGRLLSLGQIWGVSPSFLHRQTLLVMFYFAYALVVSTCLRVLHCEEIDGVRYLVEDYSEECSGFSYRTFEVLAIIGLFVFTPGIPIGIFGFLYMKREGFLANGGEDLDSKWRRQFFFLFGDFRPEFYWWELTVMGRKMLMTVIAVLLSNDSDGWQVYAATWLLLISFVAQVACLPHKDPLQRRLETAAQATVLCSLLLAQAIGYHGAQEDLLRVLILIMNVLVMAALAGVLLKQVWVKASALRHRFPSRTSRFSSSSLGQSTPGQSLASKAAVSDVEMVVVENPAHI